MMSNKYKKEQLKWLQGKTAQKDLKGLLKDTYLTENPSPSLRLIGELANLTLMSYIPRQYSKNFFKRMNKIAEDVLLMELKEDK